MSKTAMDNLLDWCLYRQLKASDNNKAAWNQIISQIEEDSQYEEKQQLINAANQDTYAESGGVSAGAIYYHATFKK